MSKIVFFLLALLSLAAICSARPIIFASVQAPPTNTTNDFFGVGYALITTAKGPENARARFFAFNNIDNTIASAYLSIGGFEIAPLRIANRTNSAGLQYVSADLRINNTVLSAMLTNQVTLTVTTTTFTTGAIVGTFLNNPNMGLAVLSRSFIVGNTTSSSTALGLAVAYAQSSLTQATTPTDLFLYETALSASYSFIINAIQNVSSPTTVTFNGPATSAQTGNVIATLTADNGVIGNVNTATIPTGTSLTTAVNSLITYQSYITVDNAIRGNFYPLVTSFRRAIPKSINVAVGSASLPTTGFNTLRRANLFGNQRNDQSYVGLRASNATGGNYTLSATITFNPSTGRGESNQLRGLELDVNLRTFGDATFSFDWFRAQSNDFIQGPTVSNVLTWTEASYAFYNPVVNQFPDSAGSVTLRVSASSANPFGIQLDLFGLRPLVSNAGTNFPIRIISRTLEALNYIAQSE